MRGYILYPLVATWHNQGSIRRTRHGETKDYLGPQGGPRLLQLVPKCLIRSCTSGRYPNNPSRPTSPGASSGYGEEITGAKKWLRPNQPQPQLSPTRLCPQSAVASKQSQSANSDRRWKFIRSPKPSRYSRTSTPKAGKLS